MKKTGASMKDGNTKEKSVKKGARREYDELEIELVMEAYGVGRQRALSILRKKMQAVEDEPKGENVKAGSIGRKRRRRGEDDLIPAEEFFNMDF